MPAAQPNPMVCMALAVMWAMASPSVTRTAGRPSSVLAWGRVMCATMRAAAAKDATCARLSPGGRNDTPSTATCTGVRVMPGGVGRRELAATRDPCHDTARGSLGLAKAGGAQLITLGWGRVIVRVPCVRVLVCGVWCSQHHSSCLLCPACTLQHPGGGGTCVTLGLFSQACLL